MKKRITSHKMQVKTKMKHMIKREELIEPLTEEKIDLLLQSSTRKKMKMLISTMDDSSNVSLHGKRSLSIQVKNKNKVRFSSVEVREYPMILGDNPSVSGGPPITIDWKYSVRYEQDIDEHIRMTPFPRRIDSQMIMPSFYRKNLLREGGYSEYDIYWASMEAKLVTSQRIATLESLKQSVIQNIKIRLKKRIKKKAFKHSKVFNEIAHLVKKGQGGSKKVKEDQKRSYLRFELLNLGKIDGLS